MIQAEAQILLYLADHEGTSKSQTSNRGPGKGTNGKAPPPPHHKR